MTATTESVPQLQELDRQDGETAAVSEHECRLRGRPSRALRLETPVGISCQAGRRPELLCTLMDLLHGHDGGLAVLSAELVGHEITGGCP